MGVQLRPPNPEPQLQSDNQVDVVMGGQGGIQTHAIQTHAIRTQTVEDSTASPLGIVDRPVQTEVQGHHGSSDSKRPRITGQGYSRVATNPPQSSQKAERRSKKTHKTLERDAILPP